MAIRRTRKKGKLIRKVIRRKQTTFTSAPGGRWYRNLKTPKHEGSWLMPEGWVPPGLRRRKKR